MFTFVQLKDEDNNYELRYELIYKQAISFHIEVDIDSDNAHDIALHIMSVLAAPSKAEKLLAYKKFQEETTTYYLVRVHQLAYSNNVSIPLNVMNSVFKIQETHRYFTNDAYEYDDVSANDALDNHQKTFQSFLFDATISEIEDKNSESDT